MNELSGRHILVVDDEILIAMMVGDQIESLGAIVVGPAFSVADAMLKLDSETVELALIDVKIGEHASYPLADALRERSIPFAFMTAYPESLIKEQFPDIPVITKPFHIGFLETQLVQIFTGNAK